MKQIIDIVEQMKTSLVRNYVIAGLDSYLVNNGKVRLFENLRNHQDSITPHSHRFNFACLVLKGQVTNKIWTERKSNHWDADEFRISELIYSNQIGEHTLKTVGDSYFAFDTKTYEEGETYYMNHTQLHSIEFSKGAKVLFFEGPTVIDKSFIIEPIVDGKVISTYKKLDYMFLTDGE